MQFSSEQWNYKNYRWLFGHIYIIHAPTILCTVLNLYYIILYYCTIYVHRVYRYENVCNKYTYCIIFVLYLLSAETTLLTNQRWVQSSSARQYTYTVLYKVVQVYVVLPTSRTHIADLIYIIKYNQNHCSACAESLFCLME